MQNKYLSGPILQGPFNHRAAPSATSDRRNVATHNLSLTDMRPNEFTKLRSLTVLLLTQQVSGTEVDKSIVADQVRTLRSLSGAGPSKHKDDRDLLRRERWFLCRRRGDLLALLLLDCGEGVYWCTVNGLSEEWGCGGEYLSVLGRGSKTLWSRQQESPVLATRAY